jgi:hypothetical protein
VEVLATDPSARRHRDFRVARGTAACWWNASKAIAASPTGCVPTTRSTSSRNT